MADSLILTKKLIEVAVPLEAINIASAREKSIRHGHPSTLHLWWARRPLAAARATLFSQLVNDPEDLWRCQHPGEEPNQQVRGHWTKARARLFTIVEDLVKWESTTNETVLQKAREEIEKSWRDTCELNKGHPQAFELFNSERMPVFYDPFAGGGTIPLEAQRLGLAAIASDLNPVAVLINKAMIQLPPKCAGRPSVSAMARSERSLLMGDSKGVEGLAADVEFYGQWMRDKAFERIGHLYPQVEVTREMTEDRIDLSPYAGKRLTVIAWIWARTVKSPNPAFSHIDVPLTGSFVLSSKKGQEAYIQPIVRQDTYSFDVRVGKPPAEAANGTKLGGSNFRCLVSGTAIDAKYIRSEAQAGRMGSRLLAVVAEGAPGRVYLSPHVSMESIARSATPIWKPDLKVPTPCHDVDRLPMYGMPTWGDAFLPRQLVALTTFADLVGEVRERVLSDASTIACGVGKSEVTAAEYADAVATFVGLAVGRSANYWSAFTPWAGDFIVQTFGRQAIRMVWDHAECNPFSSSTGNWSGAIVWIAKVIRTCLGTGIAGCAVQSAAQERSIDTPAIVSTDPPYYDNISYADLSDFFYVWLRRALKSVYPELFSTLAVPKAEELVASPYRHGSKEDAEEFFLQGMTKAMHQLAEISHVAYPVTIYYAFKQSETKSDVGTASTGWETFLNAVIRAGFSISGTWPMRTERDQGLKSGTNVLASSVILACRPRGSDAPSVSRRQFIRELNATLPLALDAMTRESEGLNSPIAPVDLSQAIIGPGMAVFSKYAAVLEADGSSMSVRTALQLINRFLAEDDFDADTQFCLHWFEQHGWEAGKFGDADTLARAKGTSVDGVRQAGVLHAGGGDVRLLKWANYQKEWDPHSDQRLPVWEVLHQLIRVFRTDGESGAAVVFACVQSKVEAARQLAYRLYTLCERNNWAEDARAYNEVVTSWSGIESAAAKEPTATQRTLFDN